jgi:hypothetical protein
MSVLSEASFLESDTAVIRRDCDNPELFITKFELSIIKVSCSGGSVD